MMLAIYYPVEYSATMEPVGCAIVLLLVYLFLEYVAWEAHDYLLENSLALEMGGRQEMEMEKFHAPTEEGPEVQSIQNSQSPS